MTSAPGSPSLVEHTFRHEYGRIVSSLARRYGFHRIELIEDAVQTAMLAALRSWANTGPPDNPAAWLIRAAHHRLLDDLRSANRSRVDFLSSDDEATASDDNLPPPDSGYFEHEIADDELRMLFVCADESLPTESRIVLALKVLSGFGTREIALRLFTSEDNVQKRLGRARERLRELEASFDSPSPDVLRARLSAVHQIVYLIFNEGYCSTQPDRLIRRELCDEAIRLGNLLAAHPEARSPEGDALLALMYLHASRFDARVDGHGGLLLLEDQDRSLWDHEKIQLGLRYLTRSAEGDVFSRYHAEAAVAVEHALAPSFAATRWNEIVQLYSMLEKIAPSPLHTLNRAIALAEWKGPDVALSLLRELKPPAWLLGYYLWDATLGELERRAGNLERARAHLERALAAAPHPAERALLERRLRACSE